jgi:hypothetical protein
VTSSADVLALFGKTTSAAKAASRRLAPSATVFVKREGTLGTDTHHRSKPTVTPGRVAAAPAWIACLLVVAALLGACSAQATTGGVPSVGGPSSSAPGATAAATGAKAATGDDWQRVLQIIADLEASPPSEPVVVLLGGSAARESTISDGSWRSQIAARGGGTILAFNMGSRNRTLAQNVAIVQALPDVPTIVYIGVNLGSFTSAQKSAAISLPQPGASEVSLEQPHQYTKSHILTAAEKRALVKAWLADRYPVFKRNCAISAGVLEKLIRACKAKTGAHPVLFELPRDSAVIGHQLDAATARYRATCRALHKRYDIPYVSLVAQTKLPNSSFYDLWHLVEPGRAVWQKQLSSRTVDLLKKYGMTGGATP